MTRSVIFDLDGTLADCAHRRPFITPPADDWAQWNGRMGDDTPCVPILQLARALQNAGNAIVVCSGRERRFRTLTEYWLLFNEVPNNALYMREINDNRDDAIVKSELLDRIIADGWEPWLVVDDRSRVVKMWRSRGLTCLQCADGDF